MHLGEKLKLYRKSKDLDQFQMAEIVGVSHRKYQDIEKTGIILRTVDKERIREILQGTAQDVAQAEIKKEVGVDPLSIIANLTESNRMLAEANLILANKINSGASDSASIPVPESDIKTRKDLEVIPLTGKIKAHRSASKKDKRMDTVKNVDS